MLSLVGDVTNTITGIIGNLGYLGVFILMTLESAGMPIPSEVIMTYGGFIATPGGIVHVVAVAVIGSLGTGLGSAIGYAVGAWGGKPFMDKYGKFFGINPQKMLWAERWFCKYGESACIYTRLLPVVRTVVNVPAGLLNMDFKKFMAYSMVGAFPWCLVLACIGYILGENWESIMGASHLLTYAVGAVVLFIIAACITLYALVRMGVIPRKTVEKYLGFLLNA
ncbi:putative membrane-associated protein [Methanocella conradii HZ254]|uniref:Membrane-associated protein n=1 Tax=Methanocella conradii (strain DSM 24694 / JCM 17849 / CGMCC 1.5162 / HZ254) TaxID=1041930 RepID=H8I5P4_METCZ|nr:DedA family protein [Methanocella conradii]AFC99363.1 putative membrane-associated protein [Methanocella conradii HZ254]